MTAFQSGAFQQNAFQVDAGGTALIAPFYENGNSFFAATVTTGPVTLTATRYDNANAFYAPTVGRGTVTLTPARFDNANAFYSPVVTQAGGTQFLAPNLFTNTNQFFGGLFTLYITFPDWVEPGWVEPGWVEWPYFNQNQFFAATVTQGDAPAADDQRGDGVDARWTKKQRKARDKQLEREREDREKLRRVIEQIIDPQAPEPVEVVATEQAVTVTNKAAPETVLPKLPTIDLAEVKREIMAAVANAQAARREQEERAAMQAEAERVAQENIRARIKRKREDELLLLM